MNRRKTLSSMVGLMALLAVPTAQVAGAASPRRPLVEVWKDPHCGCCQDWVDHLKAHGFDAKVYDEGNAEMRQRLGMPKQLGSCHTARVQGYVIEGHVPATDIQRLLKERPRALGLAVPGMPIGSPGMDGPAYGGRRDRYDVLLVTRDGRHSVYNTHS
jgi:hypothetical protein